MNQDRLNHLIQEASQLNKSEKLIVIKFLLNDENECSLTNKEKQFIEESKKHIAELQKTNTVLKSILDKYN